MLYTCMVDLFCSVLRPVLMGHASSGTWRKSINPYTRYDGIYRSESVPYRRFVRSQVIFANTMFRAVCYRPDESQIITGGTDRKVSLKCNPITHLMKTQSKHFIGHQDLAIYSWFTLLTNEIAQPVSELL